MSKRRPRCTVVRTNRDVSLLAIVMPIGLTCYVTVAREADNGPEEAMLAEVLESLGIATVGDDSVGPNTRELPERSKIASADFVIYSLGSSLTAEDAIQIGIAIGVKRPILLLAPDDLELPIILSKLRRLPIRISFDALSFQLQGFIETLPKRRRTKKPPVRRPPWSGSESVIAPKTGHSMLETSVFAALDHLGLQVLDLTSAQTGRGRYEPDAAILLPEVEPLGPVIIEIAAGVRVGEAASRLADYLRATQFHLGLVIVDDPIATPETLIAELDLAIVVAARDDLASPVKVNKTVRSLVDARNRIVHGTMGR